MPYFDRSSMYAAGVVLPVLATVAVSLRFYVRHMKGAGRGIDDWLILGALILTWALGVIVLVGTARSSFGIHTAVDPKTGLIVPTHREVDDSRDVFVFYLIMIVTYGLIKLSVLCLYRRIFVGKVFRALSLAMCVLITIWTLAFLFATAFQCGTHASAWWTGAKAIRQYCINFQSLELGYAASDIVTDVMVLAMPVPMIWRLHMTTAQKISITCIFLLGLFSTGAACVRLYYNYAAEYRSKTGYRDLIGISTTVVLWSIVEAGVGVVAASLPTLRPLFLGRSPESVINSLRSALSLHSLSSRRRSPERDIEQESFAHDDSMRHDSQTKGLADFGVEIEQPAPVHKS